MRLLVTGGLAVALLVSGVYAQQQEAGEEAIKQLISGLAADDWRVREKAQKQLILIGPPAAPYLAPLAEDPVLEIRLRVKEILSHLHVVSPEDAAQIEKVLQGYKPGAERDKIWRLVIKLRRLKNVRFYLVEKLVSAGPEQRDRIASLLACVEYRPEGRRVDKDVACATDVLLSLARDELVGTKLRLRALRALALTADRDGAAALADLDNMQQGGLASGALEALKSIRQKARGDAKETEKTDVRDWWVKAAKTPEYEKSVKHLKVRKEFEEKEKERLTPFLGVVKDQSFPDSGGAHVERPWPDSGAMKGGVEVGDIIVEFDGWRVDRWEDMVHGIRRARIGQKILLKVLRGGKVLDLEAKLSKRPEDE